MRFADDYLMLGDRFEAKILKRKRVRPNKPEFVNKVCKQ